MAWKAILALSIGATARAEDAASTPVSPPSARAGDEVELQSCIVVLKQPPVLAYTGEFEGFEATKPGKGRKVNARSAHVREYRAFLKGKHDASLRAVGLDPDRVRVNDYTIALNGYSALLTAAQAKTIAGQEDVFRVTEETMRHLHTDSTPQFLGVTGPAGAWRTGFVGEGVVIGVIDSGVWPEHPSFADDGSYTPLPLALEDTAANPACNFGNAAHNPEDAPFRCNHKLIGARQMLSTYRAVIGLTPGEFDSARDDDGHGTHTASTPGGNAGVEASIFGVPRGTVSGVAPRARVIAYKGLGALGGFASDLAAGSAADWYLGPVSHTGDAELIGLTLIDVDNR